MPSSASKGEFPKPLKPILFDILVILAQGDRHGWSIVKALENGPGGWKKILPGNLYRTLRDMKELGLIEETDPPDDAEAGGGRPRYYRITEKGRGALSVEVARLSGYVAAALAKNVT